MGEETISNLTTEEDSIQEAIVKAGLLDEVVTEDESVIDTPLAENPLASEDVLVAEDDAHGRQVCGQHCLGYVA